MLQNKTKIFIYYFREKQYPDTSHISNLNENAKFNPHRQYCSSGSNTTHP